jgi:hypothetical protein
MKRTLGRGCVGRACRRELRFELFEQRALQCVLAVLHAVAVDDRAYPGIARGYGLTSIS